MCLWLSTKLVHVDLLAHIRELSVHIAAVKLKNLYKKIRILQNIEIELENFRIKELLVLDSL